MTNPTLILGLRAVGELPTDILPTLLAPLTAAFNLAARIGPPLPHPDYAYDAERGQYLASAVIARLHAARLPGERHILGVFAGDLYAPQLSFAFGEASRSDHTAIIGLARLRTPDAALFQRRILTEAVHELGHSYGQAHCANRRCVMHFSNTLADTDYKQPTFCDRCKLKVATKSPLYCKPIFRLYY